MRDLLRCRRDVLFVENSLVLSGRPCRHTASAAVVADVIHSRVVVHDSTVIDVGDMSGTDVVHCAVISERAVVPPAAVVSGPAIPVAVIDAAIEPDMRPPVASVVSVVAADPTPISWRPQ
jgi:hypothetical protein